MTENLRRYSYSLVKIVPDPLRDETVNVGIVVVDQDARQGRADFQRFTGQLRSRLKAMLPGLDVGAIEDGVESFKSQIGLEQQLPFVGSADARVTSHEQLEQLSAAMFNQLQVSPPRAYRGPSLAVATSELYALFVSPRRRPPVKSAHMTLRSLRTQIRRVIERWGSPELQIQEKGLEQAGAFSHFADFWVEAGSPVAALIAIPDDPGERFEAWARRDSIPTIADAFARVGHRFRAVAVFPPNGKEPTPFVRETEQFLRAFENVLVLHADELEEHRAEIVPQLL